MKHHYYFCKKSAFTLAEVLITLGIIGIVAALTIPSLIANYRKHVYYTQFRKAATVIENAIQRYNEENGCGNESDGNDNLCGEIDLASDILGNTMNVTEWITDDNYEEICKGYEKIPPARNYDGTDKLTLEYMCSHDYCNESKNGHAFITNDGMFFNPCKDGGYGMGSFVDVNGPNKGPNIFGRDIFTFYLFYTDRWGRYATEGNCKEPSKDGEMDCGSRLLIEGKMNY